jgi:hypothetical protein
VSYPPEDRYWTDYLRVALPVAGLLLMLAVFWVWASNFIDGDSSDDEPLATATSAVVVDVINPPTATVTATTAVDLTDSQTPEAPGDGSDPADESDQAGDGATEPTPPDGGDPPDDSAAAFALGAIVVTNDGDLNLRSSASAASADNIVATGIAEGVEFEITGVPETDENGDLWYPVANTTDPDQVGYLFGAYLSPTE